MGCLVRGQTLSVLALCLSGAAAVSGAESPWTSLGPFGQSATVRALAVDPSNPSTIYAGTMDLSASFYRGGIFKSVDGGQSWARETMPLAFVLSVVVDPKTPSTVYAAGDAIFKSVDGGASWTSIYTGVSGNLFSLAIDPISPSTVYAIGGENGVLKTSDGGETWTVIASGLPVFYPGSLAVDPMSPSTLYLAADGTVGGLFRSTDGGQSWSRVTAVGSGGAQAVFVSPKSSSFVYASTTSGVFRSADGGIGWTSAGTGLQGFGVASFAADAESDVVYAGTGGGVFRSADHGRTWAPLGPSNVVLSVAVDTASAPAALYAGTDSTGFFRSVDAGSTWNASNAGLTGASVTTLGVNPTTPSTLYAGVSRGRVFKSGDRGASWAETGPGASEEEVTAFAFDPSAPGTVYVARSRDGLFKTTDGGASWSHADEGLSIPPFYGSQFVTALAVDPVTPKTLYAGLSTFGFGAIVNGYVFKSTDGGESWAQLPVTLSFGFVFALAVDPRAHALYAPGARSTDGGASWQLFPSPCGEAGAGSLAVAADSTLYMSCGWVYKSTDGGQSWVTFEVAGSYLVVDPTASGAVYAGGPGGVLRTLDAGATWTPANDGLTDQNVTALAIDPVNPGRVYAGTGSTGVFAKDFSGRALPLCAPSPTTLCLVGNRFEVEVAWSVPADGRSGKGMAAGLTSDTGDFWFFDQANVDLVLKVLDGRALNGSFWVFYGALSNVAYTITVTDTETGAVKTYVNASGNLASEADTDAFPPGASPANNFAAGVQKRTARELYGMYAALSGGGARHKTDAAACSPGGTTLCLDQGRFEVTVDWEVPSQGRSGSGAAVPLTADTGYFWFFSDTNVELMIKVLDGEQINGHFWVFYGALSNVAYTVTVTDTTTGAVRTYVNADGNLASVADTSAF